MKVIHLIGGGDTGGAKTHLLSLLSGLNQQIHADLVSFREGDFAADARALGIPTTVIAGNNIPKVKRQLLRMIRQNGYDVIHCHGSRANMIGALLRKTTGLPVVTTVHSDYKLDYLLAVVERLEVNEKGRIDMTQEDKASFIPQHA